MIPLMANSSSLSVLVFIFACVVFILMLTGGYLWRKAKAIRKAAKVAAAKEERKYRDETGRQRQQYNQRPQNPFYEPKEPADSNVTNNTEESTNEEQPRRTQTATGETIIDHHHQKRSNKKIFDDNDGEYVEFMEN